jgi:hypothetical protein
MKSRIIHNLQRAEFARHPPTFRAIARRGTRHQGIKYEEAVSAALPTASRGIWFKYWDDNGVGYCQPDLVLPHHTGHIWVLEVKRTDCIGARRQLAHLYIPIVENVYKLPAIGIVVAKYVSIDTPEELLCTNLLAAIEMAKSGRFPTLHWDGKGALM